MFLIDHAPKPPAQLQHLMGGVMALYEGVLKPLPVDEAIYMDMSATIQGKRTATPEIKRLMHIYLVSLLDGTDRIPAGMSRQDASFVKQALQASKWHYKVVHPIRGRKVMAA